MIKPLKYGVAVGAIIIAGLAVQATADEMTWFTSADTNNAIRDASGIPLDASLNDPLSGDFLQLVYSPSGTIFPAATSGLSPTGVTGDNVVIQTSFFGYGTDGFLDNPIPGLMQVPQTAVGTYGVGDLFFVRAWTEPAADYGAGTISSAANLLYGDSEPYLFQAAATGDDFAFDTHGGLTGFVANLRVIPEPSTGLLILLGLGLLGRRRLR